MNLNGVIERLEDYRHRLGGEAEVRLMTQRHYAFENELHGLASGEEINNPEVGEDADDVKQERVVYFVEGDQLGYGSKRAWDVAGEHRSVAPETMGRKLLNFLRIFPHSG